MVSLSESEVFSEDFALSSRRGEEMGPWKQPVLRAIGLFKKFLGREDFYKLYVRLAKKFNSNITDAQVAEICKNAKQRGFEVLVKSLRTAIMRTAPYPNAYDQTLQKPLFEFDAVLAFTDCNSSIKQNRQEYLHLVKICHEFGHVLTPGLIESKGEIVAEQVAKEAADAFLRGDKQDGERLAAMLDTPDKIGTVAHGRSHISDCGTEWEDLGCDGRVVPDTDTAPFSSELVLKHRINGEEPPRSNNVTVYKISDDYIANFLQALHDSDELPNFEIPTQSLSVLGKRARASKSAIPTKLAAADGGGYTSAEDAKDETDEQYDEEEGEVDLGPKGAAYGIAFADEDIRARKQGFKS